MLQQNVNYVIIVTIMVMGMAVHDSLVAADNYCRLNRYEKSVNSTIMQFTKEAVSREFAVLNAFKSLHCCAKGYRSIEWFKDGRPYPWPSDVSSLILYPEAENQTIYTVAASLGDNGKYTCVLRNDTHKTEHSITLTVQVNIPGSPLATFMPHDQFVPLGEPARLYCEAFVGKVKLPDARNFISWYQIFDNDQEAAVDGIQQTITREDDQIVGALLTIPEIKSHNYGRYVCRIEIGNAAHRLDMSAWLSGTPIEAAHHSPIPAIMFALGAVILVLITLFLIQFVARAVIMQQKRQRKLKEMYCEGFRVRGV